MQNGDESTTFWQDWLQVLTTGQRDEPFDDDGDVEMTETTHKPRRSKRQRTKPSRAAQRNVGYKFEFPVVSDALVFVHSPFLAGEGTGDTAKMLCGLHVDVCDTYNEWYQGVVTQSKVRGEKIRVCVHFKNWSILACSGILP